MAVRVPVVVCLASLLSSSGLAYCQAAREYVITAHRRGAIEFRDPSTLDVLRTITVDLPLNSTGLNGILADPSGRTLYIEGPEHTNPSGERGCCWLYSVALPGLEVHVAADIWGTNSRRRFVNTGSSLLTAISEGAMAATNVEGDRWQISPDGRWFAGLRSGPTVDICDIRENKIVRSVTSEGGNAEWYLNGAWIKDQFYVYTVHDGSGWLWHVSPESTDLGEPTAVPGPAAVEGCDKGFPGLTEISTAGERLVIHEAFGGKLDRRQQCEAVRGDAWMVDPSSQRPVMHIGPQFYFRRLIASTDGNSLYGLTSDDVYGDFPTQLLHLDAHSGELLHEQALIGGYWFLVVASLRSIPPEDRSLTLPVEKTR